MAKKKTSGEREQFWRDLIGRQPASGLSITRFCKEAGVSANSFFGWKRRLRPQNGQDNVGKATSRSSTRPLASSTRSNGCAAAANPLVPVRLIADPDRRRAPHAMAIEVEWPNGVVLRVPAECDGRVVRDVVKALAPLLVGGAGPC
jgi:transposase-like protein